MEDECVVAVYETLDKSRKAVHILDRAEFPSSQVSLLAAGQFEQPEMTPGLDIGDDSLHTAAVGAGLGGGFALVAGIGYLVVTGAEIFLVGPLTAAGAVTGALLGSLSGWGVHEEHLGHYQQLVKQGKALVVAHGNPLQLIQAERILAETGVSELHVHATTGDDAPDIVRS